MTPDKRARGERLFVLLLHLYPASFREHFRSDLVASFRRDRAQARFQGATGTIRFWRHTMADLVRTAVSERRGETAVAGASPTAAWYRGLGQDLRAAIRGLAKQPGYAAMAILTLGLGVGVTTAVFAVVNGVLLSPLPYDRAERLVRVYELEHNNPGARMVAYGNFVDLHDDVSGFEALAAWAFQGATLTGHGQPRRLSTPQTSADFARVFHATPVAGRWFTPAEVADNADVVVLSHSLWQDAFGADPTIVGQSIVLDGRARQVVGVMGGNFQFPTGAAAWLPLPPIKDPVGQRRWHRHSMIGRLADGTSLTALNTELSGIAARLEAAYPEYNRDNYFEARPLLADMVGSRRQSLLVLFGAVAVLLLIACVNVAALSLARSVSRRHEMALRAALGASGWRLARLMLAESLVVGALGACVALLPATVGVEQLMRLAANSVPRAANVSVNDPAVLMFGLGAAMLAALGASLPAVLSRHAEATATTLRGSRGSSARAVMTGRRGLVLAQLTAAFLLTTGAGLLIRSVLQLHAVPTGVQADGVMTFALELPAARYPDPPSVSRFIDALMARFEQVPSVRRAGVTLTAPVDQYGWYNSLTIRGRDVATPDLPHVSYVAASPGYFETVSIPLLRGRTYEVGEPRGESVVVINETAAKRFWPDEDPLGRLVLGRAGDEASWSRIIGIVGDVRQALDQPVEPTVYIPLAQEDVRGFIVMVKTDTANPADVMPSLRSLVAEADAELPITSVMTLNNRIAMTTAAPTLNAVLMASFAGAALLLAAAGVFALVSFSVAERRQEFGIRIAVGADRRRIFLDVLSGNLRLAVWAVAIGLVGVWLLGATLEGLLFGVAAADWQTVAAVAGIIVGVALAAGLWPARQATATDPLTALRGE